MALTPEDGTGLANADTYVTLAEYRAYATARGIDGPADADDAEAEADLRSAFTYVNNEYVWKSAPKVNNQAGEFPRIDLSDGMGRVFNDVPKRVKDAQCEAAILVRGGVDLFVTAERGGAVQSEAVGPISTSYFAGAPAESFFQAVDRLLKVFAKDPNCPRRPLPYFNAYDDSDPVFSVGMDDNAAEQG